MASGQVEVRRRSSVIIALLTPRHATLALLVGVGLLLGWATWKFANYQLTLYLSGLTAPLCMAIAVAAWSMRGKADEAFDADYLDAREFLQSREVARDVRLRSLLLASFCVLLAGIVSSPAMAGQMMKFFWEWQVYSACVALGLAVYSFQIAFAWEEQLRSFQEKIIAESKDAAAQQQLIERLSRTTSGERHSWGPGWGEPSDGDWAKPH